MIFSPYIGSNHYACSTLRQHTFLTNLQIAIESDKGWSIVNEDLNKVKSILADPCNIKVHLSANLDSLCELQPTAPSMLKQLIPSDAKSAEKL